jgi:hypothetical protein
MGAPTGLLMNVSLTVAVRAEIAAAFPMSRLNARAIAERVRDRNPDLVLQHGRALVTNALASIVRREIKRWRAVPDSEQFRPPGALFLILSQIPAAAWVPTEGRSGIYRTFGGADPLRWSELGVAIAGLKGQIAADTKNCDTLCELADFGRAVGADPEDRVIDTLHRQADEAEAA